MPDQRDEVSASRQSARAIISWRRRLADAKDPSMLAGNDRGIQNWRFMTKVQHKSERREAITLRCSIGAAGQNHRFHGGRRTRLPVLIVFDGIGHAEPIALSQLEAQVDTGLLFADGFNSFGKRNHADIVDGVDQPLDESSTRGVGLIESADELPVEFQVVRPDVGKFGNACLAGAEVVERQADAVFLEHRTKAHHVGDVGHGGFVNFHRLRLHRGQIAQLFDPVPGRLAGELDRVCV